MSEEGYDVYSTIGDEELKPNTNYLSVYSSVLKKKPKAMEADRPLPLPPRKVTIADVRTAMALIHIHTFIYFAQSKIGKPNKT